MKPTTLQNFPLIFLTVTVALCTAAELVLLEVKYQIFAGGFLQSHQLATSSQRIIFILLFIVFNFILYGGLFFVWKKTLGVFNFRNNIISFHFMMISLVVTAIFLVAQFQLHKYFADAMDVALIRNIAGGDLETAFVYILDEVFLFIVGFVLSIAGYIAVYRVFRNTLIKYESVPKQYPARRANLKLFSYATIGLFPTAILVLLSNTNYTLAYNLNRTNSYSAISSLLNRASDFDFDGYGSFKYPQDTKAFDSTVYPGALDILDNGIDEDGFFGDFVSYSPATDVLVGSTPPEKLRHIIIIVLESARAEIVEKTLDGELVAPNINALAHEGLSVKEAYSHTGFTASSLSSFFSGRIGLFDKKISLFSLLKKIGYQVAIISGQDESWGQLDQKLGTRETADYFFDAQVGVKERVYPSKLPSSIKLSEETLWKQFKVYSDNLEWNQPQFIYFNMQAGHFPYYHEKMTNRFVSEGIPRSEINHENKDWLVRTYWNSMSYADFFIGKIVAELKEIGVWDDTLLIITGDHGEELFDENHLGHGFFLSDVQTGIPFVVNKSDFRVIEPVGLSDLNGFIFSYVYRDYDSFYQQNSDKKKSVFQMIGSLNRPNKIGLRYPDNKQISFDLRNMLVRKFDSVDWIPYDQAISEPNTERALRELILHWENLRWQSFLEEKSQKR